jgi:hypothetical protein
MSRIPLPSAARLLEYLAAIAGGNAVYFLLLYRHLPRAWRHAPFRVDPGFLADLFCCAAVYAAVRLAAVLVGRQRRDPYF